MQQLQHTLANKHTQSTQIQTHTHTHLCKHSQLTLKFELGKKVAHGCDIIAITFVSVVVVLVATALVCVPTRYIL